MEPVGATMTDQKFVYKNDAHMLKDRMYSLYIYLDLAAKHIRMTGPEFEETYQWVRVAEVNADQAAKHCSGLDGCTDQLHAIRGLRNRLDEASDDFADALIFDIGLGESKLREKYEQPLKNFRAITKEIIAALINAHAIE